jgi:hypothetical protein
VSGIGIGTIASPFGDISMFPNPAQDVVAFESKVHLNVLVRDVQGRIMVTGSTSRSLDLSQLAGGVYLVQFVGKNGEIVAYGRLVKNGRN